MLSLFFGKVFTPSIRKKNNHNSSAGVVGKSLFFHNIDNIPSMSLIPDIHLISKTEFILGGW